MRVAVLSDVHGNLAAFEAALADARAQSPDQIILAGDYINGGPDSQACLHLALNSGLVALRGNHERYVCQAGTLRQHVRWNTPWFSSVRFAYQSFSQADFDAMRALPYDYHGDDFYVVHSTTRDDHDFIDENATDAMFERFFPGIKAGIIIRGHNHRHRIDYWGQRPVITSGSVGIGLSGAPKAVYSLATRSNGRWHAEHRYVDYDLEHTLKRFEETAYLEYTGVIGKLYRLELMTGKNIIVAFIERYRDRLDSGQITWDWAWDDFQRYC